MPLLKMELPHGTDILATRGTLDKVRSLLLMNSNGMHTCGVVELEMGYVKGIVAVFLFGSLQLQCSYLLLYYDTCLLVPQNYISQSSLDISFNSDWFPLEIPLL